MWVGISAVGVFETRDGGATWEPRNKGVRADFVPGPPPETGQCVHKFAMAAGEPETLYQQNHCGLYRSTDGGATWTDLSANGLPSQFGFPLVAHPRDPKTFWVIPLNEPDEGRFMPDARAAVWRTHDRGDTWVRGDEGLPQEDAYLGVLREAMARDTLDPVGVTFGTKTGQLWHSSDEGASWRLHHRRPARDLGGRGGRHARLTDGHRPAARLAARAVPGRRATARRRRGDGRGRDPGARREGARACATGSSSPARGCGRTSTCSSTAQPADLATPVADRATVHVIPAVSGG